MKEPDFFTHIFIEQSQYKPILASLINMANLQSETHLKNTFLVIVFDFSVTLT